MVYKTFDEWSNLGYKIIKGSRATRINDKPMFSDSQVQKVSKYSSGNRYTGSCEYEDQEDSIYYYLAPNHW